MAFFGENLVVKGLINKSREQHLNNDISTSLVSIWDLWHGMTLLYM